MYFKCNPLILNSILVPRNQFWIEFCKFFQAGVIPKRKISVPKNHPVEQGFESNVWKNMQLINYKSDGQYGKAGNNQYWANSHQGTSYRIICWGLDFSFSKCSFQCCKEMYGIEFFGFETASYQGGGSN